MSNSWINKTESMPPRNEDIPWVTIDVIVSDGVERGVGHYDYDMEYWHYSFVGKIESDDNRITIWQYFPDFPKE